MSKTLDEWKEEKREEGVKAAQDLASALNSLSYEKNVIQGFVDTIVCQHRSLQQSTMRGIFALIMKWAEMGDNGCYDLRNEQTVKFCQKVRDLVEKENFSFPLI